MHRAGVVLLTDRAWPGDTIERRTIEGAAFELVAGPADPAPRETIEDMVKTHDPVAIMTCWAPVSATAIRTPSRLRVVTRMGVGLDNIDVPAATKRGTLVTNVPDYCVEEVSDHAVGLVLDWARGIAAFDRDVRADRWNPAGARLKRLRSKTVGIVGYGRIGRATARKCAAFGCRVVVHTRTVDPHADVEFVSWPDLLGMADVVVLHVPLTPGTRHMVGAPEFAAMRADALLVNVSRGGLVDTAALVDALDTGRIGGAALDVLEDEPTVAPTLQAHPNVVITPHVAFSSDESIEDLRTKAAEDVVRVLRGQAPRYPCNTPPVCSDTEEHARWHG